MLETHGARFLRLGTGRRAGTFCHDFQFDTRGEGRTLFGVGPACGWLGSQ